MENIEIIQKLFNNFKCSGCDNYFAKDAVEVVRREENNIVVRVECTYCNKNMGLAILGLDSGEYKNSLKFQKFQCEDEDKCLKQDIPDDPITYEEVMEAHKFFSSLGSDWIKHLPERNQ